MSARDEFDEEDFFADTRMSFGDHLEVLRKHLWRAIYGLGICMGIGFALDAVGDMINVPSIGIGRPLMNIIQDPVRKALVEFYDRREEKFRDTARRIPDSAEAQAQEPKDFPITYSGEELDKLRGLSREEIALIKGRRVEEIPDTVTITGKFNPYAVWKPINRIETMIRPRELTALSAQEGFVIYFKVSLIAGVVIASPWVFFQIWSFIAAGLYPNEKRYVHLYLPISVGLFVIGVILCQFMVMPKAVSALLWFNEFLGVTPDLRLSEWLSLAIMLPVVFGLSFQTPLVMLFLERIGIMTADTFRGYRKAAIMIMAIFAAVITPTPDAITMCYLWIPMCLLYELGIWLCALSPNRKRDLDELDVPESDELIEV